MSNIELGRLVQVPIREVWKHEAQDFTQWLALPENLEYISEAIGVELVDAQTEVSVGQFKVDILAKDENGRRVVVENQLEPTNHDHLGKVITYAAGLQANVVVWIVRQARAEHEQAINWLNANTTEDANFFLFQVEAWKIGDSRPAPLLNVIAQPNDWAKEVKKSADGNPSSELKLLQAAVFERVRELGDQSAKFARRWRQARPHHWYDVAIGSSQAHIALTLNSRDKRVAVEIYIKDNKELFFKLQGQREVIESELGLELEWAELPEGKASRIITKRSGDFTDEAQVDDLVNWLVATADEFARVFPKLL